MEKKKTTWGGARKNAGRKELKEKKLAAHISLWLSVEEKEIIDNAAKDKEMKTAQFVKEIIFKHLKIKK